MAFASHFSRTFARSPGSNLTTAIGPATERTRLTQPAEDTLQKIILQEQWMVVVAEPNRVNHGGTISRNEQASHCRR